MADVEEEAVEETPEAEEAEVEDVVGTLVPRSEPRTWEIKQLDPDVKEKGESKVVASETYVQKPLSFFGKIELFALLSETIDDAMSGPEGASLSNLLEGPRIRGGQLDTADIVDADAFVKTITKLARHSPEMLQDAYAIILGVPGEERAWFKYVITGPADRGGLADEEGFEILETFIDQNWEALQSFFGDRISQLVKRGQAKQKKDQDPSPSSKPSKRTRRRTQKV